MSENPNDTEQEKQEEASQPPPLNDFQRRLVDGDVHRMVGLLHTYAANQSAAAYINAEVDRLHKRLDLLRDNKKSPEHRDAVQKLYELSAFGEVMTAYQKWRAGIQAKHEPPPSGIITP